VSIGDTVRLEIAGRWYTSRVENIRPGEIHAGAPFERGSLILLVPEQKLVLGVYVESGLRRFSAKVKAMMHDRVPIVILSEFADLGMLQRRAYERVPDELPVRLRPEARFDVGWARGITRDIGGGGVHLVADGNAELQVGDFVEIELVLPGEKPISGVARIVRSSPVPGSRKLRVALQFGLMDPSERSRIINYVRRKMAEFGRRRRAA